MIEIHKTGGGTLTYLEAKHRYEFDGARVDLSVSSVAGGYPLNFGIASGWASKVIREELIKSEIPLTFDSADAKAEWAKELCKAPARFTKSAGGTGTIVHKYVEDLGHGLEPELHEDIAIARCQQALGDWFKANIAEVLHVERRLYSPKWKIAGTCDMVAKLRNGQVHVLDWKGVTDLKAGLKAGHVGQLAAYRAMLQEAGEEIDGTTLVRFSRKTGEVDPVTFTHHEDDLAAFEAALHLARYKPKATVF
jgi:hypothetical protein